jgi:predicted nucleic acid-binding Zn ribbon protein
LQKDRECKYCHKQFPNIEGKIFSNHVRWCSSNKTNGDKGKSNLSKSATLDKITITKNCEKCGREFDVIRNIRKDGSQVISQSEIRYCSRSCANGQIHSEEWKENIGKAFRGKTYKLEPVEQISKERKKRPHGLRRKVYVKKVVETKICPICGELYTKNTMTCGDKCGRQYRNRNVDKSSLKNYRQQCAFQFALNEYPNEFDFSLIEEYGWYKAKNHGDNLYGVSRDHIVSVKYGWLNNIPPEIIRHPANCRLMKHSDNVSKGEDCGMTIDELYFKIEKWNKKYNQSYV